MSPGGASIYCSPHPAPLQIDSPPGSGSFAFRISRRRGFSRQSNYLELSAFLNISESSSAKPFLVKFFAPFALDFRIEEQKVMASESHMTNPPDREVAVFGAALRLPAGERAAFLDQACAGDAAFRKRVEELLEASEEAGDFLGSPAATPSGGTFRLPANKPGDRIGRYKLLQQIGEGGCGVVYMAEQEEPVRRRVALKVIKLGMDTKNVIARFEAERQALALMEHPNIAKVLDAGATETGRPYFVMELVRGIKITDYCDQNDLSTRERLGLFINVCQAIQHAHQKGVIHRDIKPRTSWSPWRTACRRQKSLTSVLPKRHRAN
jgi:Protein kinase domain